jgi:hypothetical protein
VKKGDGKEEEEEKRRRGKGQGKGRRCNRRRCRVIGGRWDGKTRDSSW